MNVEQMRIEVAKAYSGKAWKKRVRMMSDSQVTAVYFSLVHQNKDVGFRRGLRSIPINIDVELATSSNATTTRTEFNQIIVPYADTNMGEYTICSKEVLLTGWENTVGKWLDFNNKMRFVKKLWLRTAIS